MFLSQMNGFINTTGPKNTSHPLMPFSHGEKRLQFRSIILLFWLISVILAPVVAEWNQVHWKLAKTGVQVTKPTSSTPLVMLPESLFVLDGVMQHMEVIGERMHKIGIRRFATLPLKPPPPRKPPDPTPKQLDLSERKWWLKLYSPAHTNPNCIFESGLNVMPLLRVP